MWCVAELDEPYIARMEDVLAVYEKPLSAREPVVCVDEKPVVLHQEVRQGSAHGLFDHTINTATHKHAAALDVNGSDGIGEQHDGQDEPRSCFPDKVFSNCASVECGRTHVVEHDGCGSPKRDKYKHGGRCDQHPLSAGCLYV
jgi:hypothetical protein